MAEETRGAYITKVDLEAAIARHEEIIRRRNGGEWIALIADNPDWDTLNPVLIDWGIMLDVAMARNHDIKILLPALRCTIEYAYALGYAYGKSETAHG